MKKKIYLIPGFMCDENLWCRLIPLFDETYEFVHLEIPLEDSFDKIAEVLDKKIEKDANILGFSLGGYIAIYYSLKYPQKVNKILAVACTASSLAKEEVEKRTNAIRLTKEYGFKGLSRKKVLSLVEPKNQKDEELINLILKMYVDLGEEAFYSQFKATIIRTDLSSQLINSQIPIEFFYANEDRLVSLEWMNSLKEKAKNIKFTQIEAKTHMLPLEREKELSNEIKSWF